jgi:hypothetical protein
MRVTVAVPDWSPVPLALIVTALDEGMMAGAVNRPAEVIVPADADHVTLDWPVAVNCCVPPSITFAVDGDTVIGCAGALSVTVAVPDWLPDPVAVMVTVLEEGMVAGAVNRPAEVIVPADADHVTLDCPVAVNCRVPPSVTFAVEGDTTIAETNVTVRVLVDAIGPGTITVNAIVPAAFHAPLATMVVGVTDTVEISLGPAKTHELG